MDQLVILRNSEECQFCQTSQNDQFKFGPLYRLKNVIAHYYCVLLSTKMQQNGTDKEGMLGFLLSDIKNELTRTINVKCTYCKKGRATIKCCHSKCRRVFHLPCGLNAGSLHQFMDSFNSYCFYHRPVQLIPEKIINEATNSEMKCAICFEEIDIRDKKDTLWAPCCTKTWYHRNCVQKLAHSAGYFFKCAICNDDKKFKKYMLQFGIFIPQQDASWELEPNAFEELLFKYNHCDADNCKCPYGREKNVEDTPWEIILCKSCGSHGIHKLCGSLKFFKPKWECPTCMVISKNNSTTGTSRRKLSTIESSSNSELTMRGKKKRMRVSDYLENSILDKRKRRRNSEEEFMVGVQAVEETSNHYKAYEKNELDVDESGEVDVETMEPKKSNQNLSTYEALSKLKPGPLSYKLELIRREFGSFPSTSEKKSITEVMLDSDSEQDDIDPSDSSHERGNGGDVEIIREIKNTISKENSLSIDHYRVKKEKSRQKEEDEEVEVIECVDLCQKPNRVGKEQERVIECIDLCQQSNRITKVEENRTNFCLNDFEIIGALNTLPPGSNQENQESQLHQSYNEPIKMTLQIFRMQAYNGFKRQQSSNS